MGGVGECNHLITRVKPMQPQEVATGHQMHLQNQHMRPLRMYAHPADCQDFTPTERWAAYIEPATGYGIGVFTPVATGLTSYRVGRDTSTRASDTSYFALTATYDIPRCVAGRNKHAAARRTTAATVRVCLRRARSSLPCANLQTFHDTPRNATRAYRAYVAVGRVDEMRET